MTLLTENIWEIITRSVKKSLPNYVAVAYFGTGGAELLPLKEGDVLVVDASISSVKSGITNPNELKILLKKGVRIFTYPKLHSKIYVFGKTMFIGSANVSTNSKENLFEAVLQVNDVNVDVAIDYIKSLIISPLGKKELEDLIKIYRPPKSFNNRGELVSEAYVNRVYISKVDVVSFSDGFEEPLRKGSEKVDKLELDRTRLILSEVEFPSIPEISVGDVFLMLNDKDGMVSPPSRVLHIEPWEDSERHFIFYSTINKDRMNKERFLKKIGGKLIREGFLSKKRSNSVFKVWNVTYNQI